MFMSSLDDAERRKLDRLQVTLLGSLAWTGKGHHTDKAVMLGLSGLAPESIDPDDADRRVADITTHKRLLLSDGASIAFDPARDIDFNFEEPAPVHPNTIRFVALDRDGRELAAADLVLAGRWFRPARRRGRVLRRYRGANSLRLHRCRRIDCDGRPFRPYHRRDGAGQRGGVRRRCGDQCQARPPRCRDVRLHRARNAQRRRVAGRTEGQAQGACVASPPAGRGNAQHPQFDSCDGLCEPLCHRRQRGERIGRARGDRADQRGRRRDPRRAALLFRALPGRLGGRHEDFSPDRRGRSAGSANAMRRSPAPRWGARARSAWPARWPPQALPPRSAAATGRSRMPRRSAWSITSG